VLNFPHSASAQAAVLLSREHFSIDGALIDA
jgi:hypothetical protein